eukprot:130854-Prorocentrum_minimum.AAC.1
MRDRPIGDGDRKFGSLVPDWLDSFFLSLRSYRSESDRSLFGFLLGGARPLERSYRSEER